MTIHEALQHAGKVLAAVSDTSVLDAEVMLAHVLSCQRTHLRSHALQVLADEQAGKFSELIERRMQREPIAYITGRKEFWSLELEVDRGTLIPRPETELIVETVLELFPDKNACLTAADLGTGSGAIALALSSERPNWNIHAVDISEAAIAVASKNAQRLGLMKVSFYCGSWFTALPEYQFDFVVSNPPYLSEQEWPAYAEGLAFEPRGALVSAEDGLHDIRKICNDARMFIRSGGFLIMEHGFQQGMPVREIFKSAGCCNVRTILDLAGRERVTVGQF